MQFFIITSCTQRKRITAGIPLSANGLNSGSIESLAISWLRLTEKQKHRTRASDLYIGRSVSEAKKAKRFLNGRLLFASAGFGLVSELDEIPAYDLSASSGDNSITSLISDVEFAPHVWWRCINSHLGKPNPISCLLNSGPDVFLIIALSQSYMAMIAEDLATIHPSNVQRLRIITSKSGVNLLTNSIKNAVIPYDYRFDGVGCPNPGTRGDFPQRAMRHFIEHILRPTDPDISEERSQVSGFLEGLKIKKIPNREKKTDEELILIMLDNWSLAAGLSSRMLKVLRNDLRVACEQRRCSELFKIARERRNINLLLEKI